MYNLAFRIWLTAQLVFIAGLSTYCVFSGNAGGAAGIILITFLVGMACSAPAFFILGALLKAFLKPAGNSCQAMLAAAIAAAVSAAVNYTGWSAVISAPGMFLTEFKNGIGFLLIVIGCTSVATLIQYRQFRHCNPGSASANN